MTGPKADLRRLARERRRASGGADDEQSRAVCEGLLALPEIQSARTVMVFIRTGGEIDLSPLCGAAAGKKLFAAPRVTGKGTMEAADISQGLAEGYRGIMEPVGPAVPKSGIDAVIVPALMYDRRGYRLGYGGGFYDRFLKECPALRIGVCTTDFLADDVFPDEWDEPVDIIVTDREVIRLR